MSLLSSQLRDIAQKDKEVRGSLAGRKERPSLLFENKDAADYDDEAIYNLAIEGFRFLSQKDPSLEVFEERFLGSRLVSFDISHMTRSERKEIEGPISSFLIHLSPHHIGGGEESHQVLEWMIRKWKVNESFVDELLTSIICHHDTDFFIKVLQTVYFNDQIKGKWGFLYERCKRDSQTISRQILAQRCQVDKGLWVKIWHAFNVYQRESEISPSYVFGDRFCSFITYLSMEAIVNHSSTWEDADTIKWYQRVEQMIKVPSFKEAILASSMLFFTLLGKNSLSQEAKTFYFRRLLVQTNQEVDDEEFRSKITEIIRKAIELGWIVKTDDENISSLVLPPNTPSSIEELFNN